jgi:SH3-like domain-containing protein
MHVSGFGQREWNTVSREADVMKIRIVLVLLAFSAGVVFAAQMSVQVRDGKVRATPSQLGRVVTTVEYGALVQAGVPQNGWCSVTTADGKTGWLHESALSKKPIAMRAGATDAATGVSSDEVALAGKGFNEQVEAKFKKDGKLDYTWVDRMAAFNAASDRIEQFRAQGHLAGGVQ